jgi:hypothetical protein
LTEIGFDLTAIITAEFQSRVGAQRNQEVSVRMLMKLSDSAQIDDSRTVNAYELPSSAGEIRFGMKVDPLAAAQ